MHGLVGYQMGLYICQKGNATQHKTQITRQSLSKKNEHPQVGSEPSFPGRAREATAAGPELVGFNSPIQNNAEANISTVM